MLYATGIDIIEIERIRSAIERFGERFIERVFTTKEIDYCASQKDGAKHFAARFAAKEAVYKSLRPASDIQMRWKDIEVIKDSHGIPAVRLHGLLAQRQQEAGIENIAISFSHSRQFAAAVAIAVKK